MVKMVSLSDKAYDRLKVRKGLKSFSEVVVELTNEKSEKYKDIMKFAGIFKDNSDEWGRIEKEIYAERKKAKLKDYKW
ncbi:MAG: antitoxin VapB family protein [Nanoarchaeota archaeon]